MRDQRFAFGEFELEFFTQERPELLLDLFGLCFRASKAQAEIIGIPTILESPIVWVVNVVSRQSLCLFSQALSSLLLPVLEAPLCSAHQSLVLLVQPSLDPFGVLRDEDGFDERV